MAAGTLNLEKIPTELWWHISFFITTENDLRHLCLTSKYFLPESRRLLYRDVQLKGTRNVILWTETILSSSTHVPLVASLTLPAHGELNDYHIAALSKSLARLHNLVDLKISQSMNDNRTSIYLTPSILMDIPRSLRTFRSELEGIDLQRSLFRPSGLYQTHSDINRIYVPSIRVSDVLPESYGEILPSDVLSNLATLHIECLHVLSAFRLRSIKRLRIGRVDLVRSEVEQLLLALESHQDTLVALCIGFYEVPKVLTPSEQLHVNSFIKELASSVPQLSHLCILGDVTEYMESEEDIAALLMSFKTLPNLKTLILGASRPTDSPRSSQTYVDSALCTPKFMTALACRFFNHCKGLEKISLVCAAGKHLQRDLVGGEVMCFARNRRALTGMAECENGDYLDDESWALV